MTIDIKIVTKEEPGAFSIIPDIQVSAIKHRVKDILDDLAEEVRLVATEFAPISEESDKMGGSARDIPSGTLKAHPVDISKSGYGRVQNIANEAEGFRSVRAPAGSIDPATGKKIGGQFVKGKASSADFGHIFYKIDITYPKEPFYIKYVTQGTGIYGPHAHPIVPITAKRMRYFYKGKKWAMKSVLGQMPQPYLDEVSDHISRYYVPVKMAELRAEVDAL